MQGEMNKTEEFSGREENSFRWRRLSADFFALASFVF